MGKLDTQRGDVGAIQVKTVLGDNDCLLIRDHDPDDKNYVLCQVRGMTTVQLVGWIEGKNGKVKEYWNTKAHRPCFFVSRDVLKPINKLPR